MSLESCAKLRGLSLLALAPALALTACFALTLGRYPLSFCDIADFAEAALGWTALEPTRYDLLHNIIVEIRIPRVLAAGLVGAALASSGASFQAVFRNPLVSPGILGVLGGASFGAALGILFFGNGVMVQIMAFALGIVAVGAGVAIANLFGSASAVMLVLGGMISGALFTSLLSIVKYTADPNDQLPAIVYWLMGSFSNISLKQAMLAGAPILLGVACLSALGRALDAMSMGDDEARSLGIPVDAVRYGVIAAATLISSLSVALSGMIGWVGLIVPHFARLALGPLNSRLLPASAMLGAIFLILADCVARVAAHAEIPIGVITELFGIPAFIAVLRHARREWL